ncbi:MAG: hypothetical protein J5485_03260 [Candidatus Methanomethylophilaceae archaeon]|nr:hypothetical protein [Candidatus Methanomethylophilaceae archaeon]
MLLFLLLSGKLGAQSIDPTLAAMIALYTEKAENTLKSQEEAMLLESTGHVWIKEEVDGTWQIQKEFNDYLDTFRGIIVYAAQIYGFYHEIDKMVGNMGKLNDQIAKSPGNAVAVARSANRNKVYRQVILQSVEIVNDIRMVCLSDVKMTEKERTEVFFGVRPKLKEMNKTLQRLIKAVKYTSLTDVWNEITERQPSKADVPDITDKAFQRWRSIGKTVRP